MEALLLQIVELLRTRRSISQRELAALVNAACAREGGASRVFSKKHLLPYYYQVKRERPEVWASWEIGEELEHRLVATLQMKPHRTASGVATVTVITKPWPCSGACSFCPSDLRMPKSYLHDEPACQRAERAFFDPYLQVTTRLRALHEMGHCTDKVELIVLGGTWTDYPPAYRRWFVRELFAALNEGPYDEAAQQRRRSCYEHVGIPSGEKELAAFVGEWQREVAAGRCSYAQAHRRLYGPGSAAWRADAWQQAGMDEVRAAQLANETAARRCVGLVVETRPDAISCASLRELRELGCTKVQMGVQSLDDGVLARCVRGCNVTDMRRAFGLLRLFGFKVHAHFMVNLPGATPDFDKREYERFVSEPAWQPDEIKLYPCALIAGTPLVSDYESGAWCPYTEEMLLDVLEHAVRATPPYTRISRMVRDFSSDDIVAGNKKPNLRQLVEARLDGDEGTVAEIRYREVREREVALQQLSLQELRYLTDVSEEVFLQWVDSQGGIAGFLRLSLPREEALAACGDELPVHAGEAMIREVHVYGNVAGLRQGEANAQHHGLGRQLVMHACVIAGREGYRAVNVISAVGTREYYRRLGFEDGELYQQRVL